MLKWYCYGLLKCVAHSLLMVCSAGALGLLWCSAMVKPAKRYGRTKVDQVLSVTLVTLSTENLGLVTALALWSCLLWF